MSYPTADMVIQIVIYWSSARGASGDHPVWERHCYPEERRTVWAHLQLHQREPELQSQVGFSFHCGEIDIRIWRVDFCLCVYVLVISEQDLYQWKSTVCVFIELKMQPSIEWWPIGSFFFVFFSNHNDNNGKRARHPPLLCIVYLFWPQKPDESFTSHILSSSRGYQLAASLSIPAVSQSDSGPYRCYALNERGGSATELQLDVRGEQCMSRFCMCVGGAVHCSHPSAQIFAAIFAAHERLNETHKVSATCSK